MKRTFEIIHKILESLCFILGRLEKSLEIACRCANIELQIFLSLPRMLHQAEKQLKSSNQM